MAPPTGVYLAVHTNGLGNRLNGILGASAVAAAFKVPFYCYWVRNSHCSCEAADLFRFLPGLMDRKAWHEQIKTEPQALKFVASYIVVHGPAFFHRYAVATGIDKTAFMAHAKQAFNALQPTDAISDSLTSQCSHWPAGLNPVGLHVRLTDRCFRHGGAIRGKAKYHRRLKTLLEDPTTLAVLAGDDLDFLDELKTAGDSRCIRTASSRRKTGFRQTTITDALTDLLLLARTSIIYSETTSTFARLAAFYGGIDLKSV